MKAKIFIDGTIEKEIAFDPKVNKHIDILLEINIALWLETGGLDRFPKKARFVYKDLDITYDLEIEAQYCCLATPIVEAIANVEEKDLSRK